jgi:hypothetical protein
VAAAAGAASSVGNALGWLELLSGWRGVPLALQPASGVQELTATALPPAPSALVIGDDLPAVSLLAALANLLPGLAVAPPGLVEAEPGRWDEPAPWSMHMARVARACGWSIPVGLAAKRLERERPRTWLDACLTLAAIHAWLCGRTRFVVAVAGPAGLDLARRLPDVPVVVASRRQLLRPERVFGRIEALLDEQRTEGAPAGEQDDPDAARGTMRAGGRS